jgi:hypothetical protein
LEPDRCGGRVVSGTSGRSRSAVVEPPVDGIPVGSPERTMAPLIRRPRRDESVVWSMRWPSRQRPSMTVTRASQSVQYPCGTSILLRGRSARPPHVT